MDLRLYTDQDYYRLQNSYHELIGSYNTQVDLLLKKIAILEEERDKQKVIVENLLSTIEGITGVVDSMAKDYKG